MPTLKLDDKSDLMYDPYYINAQRYLQAQAKTQERQNLIYNRHQQEIAIPE